jgi:cytochrome c-type biogenesis protein
VTLNGVGPALAFAAGLASVLSPCVLPLLPAYLAYLARPSRDGASPSRLATLVSALAFVAGLALVFILFFYALTSLLTPVRRYVPPVAGVLVVLMGLYVAGALKLPPLGREVRLMKQAPERGGAVGGFLLGVGFAAGWTPCIGLTLGAVLGTAAVQGPSAAGLALLAAYCLGLGLPFVLLGLGVGRAAALARAVAGRRRIVDLASGGVLVAMGLVLLTNNLVAVTQLLSHALPSQLTDPFGL